MRKLRPSLGSFLLPETLYGKASLTENKMHRFHKLFENIYGTGSFLLSGALILSLFQIPSESSHFIASSVKPGATEKLKESAVSPLSESFLGAEVSLKSTQEAINRQMYFVSSGKAYSASLAVGH